MKNIILVLTCSLAFIVSCSEQTLYEIPKTDGKVVIYGVATSTTTGISTLDDGFTLNVQFATAKAGDVMNGVLLKLQIPAGGGTEKQWLPLAGTEKTQTLGTDLKWSVTYTRAEAQMTAAGDAVKVVFAGETDSHTKTITMVPATAVSNPRVQNKDVVVARTTDTAYFNVTVSTLSGTYSGTITAKRKNGKNAAWVDAGAASFTAPAKVPISGNDFAAGKDTMYYEFKATKGANTDVINKTIVITKPYFFFKKSGTLVLGANTGGLDLRNNGSVNANDVKAILAIDGGSLVLHGGSGWLALGGKSIGFVPSTLALYNANSSNDVIAAYAAGTATATADPVAGQGVYIFKVVNGPLIKDTYYGMIKITSIVPGTSLTYEYWIGNLYEHLGIMQ